MGCWANERHLLKSAEGVEGVEGALVVPWVSGRLNLGLGSLVLGSLVLGYCKKALGWRYEVQGYILACKLLQYSTEYLLLVTLLVSRHSCIVT